MTWTSALLALLVSHLVGDLLLQTDWQAVTKVRGLGDLEARRALLHHVASYTAAFLPALAWVAAETNAGRAIAVGAVVAIPHLVIDDGRLVRSWVRRVKGAEQPTLGLVVAVDQTFHVVCLFGAALLAAA